MIQFQLVNYNSIHQLQSEFIPIWSLKIWNMSAILLKSCFRYWRHNLSLLYQILDFRFFFLIGVSLLATNIMNLDCNYTLVPWESSCFYFLFFRIFDWSYSSNSRLEFHFQLDGNFLIPVLFSNFQLRIFYSLLFF